MPLPFEGKSAGQIANEIVNDIYFLANPIDINSTLQALDALDAGKRTAVIDTLEKLVVEEERFNADDYKTLGPLLEGFDKLTAIFNKGLGKEEQVSKEEAADIEALQSAGKLINYIADAKGDAAHPVIKEISKTVSSLSGADYNSFMKLVAAFASATERGDQIARGTTPAPEAKAPEAKAAEPPKAPKQNKPKGGKYKF